MCDDRRGYGLRVTHRSFSTRMGLLVRGHLAAERVHRVVARRRQDSDRVDLLVRHSAEAQRAEAYNDSRAGSWMPPDGARDASASRSVRSRCAPGCARAATLQSTRARRDWRFIFERDDSRALRIVAALEGHGDPADNVSRMLSSTPAARERPRGADHGDETQPPRADLRMLPSDVSDVGRDRRSRFAVLASRWSTHSRIPPCGRCATSTISLRRTLRVHRRSSRISRRLPL